MSFGEFEQSFDFAFSIAPGDWQGSAPTLFFPLVGAAPNAGETLLEQFGCDDLSAVGGNYPRWGLYANGNPVGDYGAIPAAVQLGTVAVPVLSSRTRFVGPLEIRLMGGTVTPTAPVGVRVKGAQSHRLTFRDEMLARFQPKPTLLDRIRSALRVA